MTSYKYTNRTYLDALQERVLIFDGAMGTSLQLQNLTAEHFGGEKYVGCNDYLVLTYPEAVEKVHRSFFDVGVDVVETDTFRSNRLTLDEYGLGDKTYEINFAAAQLARKIADEYSASAPPLNLPPTGEERQVLPPAGEGFRKGERFVAGSIGPTGKLPSADDPDLSDLGYDDLAELFREQATGLLEGGVDLLLIETSQDILEVKAAIEGIQTAFAETKIIVPLQAQITLDTTGRMLFGTDIAAAVSILEGLPIDVIGMNCSTGPEHMRAPIEFLGENTSLPVSCIPNAGMPMNVDGEAVYHLEPENFANDLYEFVEKNNISVVGGCCGTTPAHLSALVEKMRGTAHPHRPDRSTPRLASGIRSFTMRQEPAPLIIGERCNAQGSRKFKRLLLEENWDEILEVARQQVDYGSHALDISVAVTENDDEAQLMHDVVRKLVTAGIDVPLVFDTTDIAVMEAGLKVAPGRSMLNSTHLESGREKADKVFALARKHNATVLVLTIDEKGMAKTAERKLEVAKRIYDIAVNEHGLKPEDLIFDDLTFTLATGEAEYIDSAKDTIEGIKLIKSELPGVFTSLGVSNVSFGLSKGARPIINSTFLYHCVQAGLDMAIINPAHTPPFGEIPADEREMAEDLIFNKRPDALQRIIEHFEGREATALDTSIDPTEGMTLAERLHWRIVLRQPGAVGDSMSVENDVVEIVEGAFLPSPLGRRVGDEGDGPTKLPMSEAFKARVRELRKEATEPEKLMWTLLRNRGLDGAKFRRQHPHKGYVLDFYCHAAKLAIELDGSGHLEEDQIHHDEERTKILEEDGIKVLRFWNSELSNDTETVLGEIWEALDERGGFPHPSPLPKGEGTLDVSEKFDNLHDSAIYQLNNVLLPAMKEVGDKFGAGELILPFVLQSAEVMKKAVARLEQYLERAEGTSKGKVVLATVYGDVHDIGKNLVKTILTNNGFEVVDLGKQVPAETIINTAIEEKADAIGLSALLVSTSKQMPLIVNELHRRGQNIPVMLGGAAINRRFGLRINKTEDGGQYGAGAFYCKDAFEGLETMEELQDDKRKPALVERLQAQVTREAERASQEKSKKNVSIQRSKVVPNPIPLPSKLGAKIVKDMPLEMVFEHLYKKELFRLSWGAKNAHGTEWEKLEAEFEARLAKMKKEAVQTGWLKPQGVYGFFPCLADGDDLVIYNPENTAESLTRFSFPRQPTGDNLCLADYFAPVGSDKMDVVAFQVVTVGQEATEKFDALQDAGDYSEGYYVHGLAVQTAEAAANYLHAHIQREMGIDPKQGKRYSWGYPAIPDLDDHKKVFDLLPVEEALGMTLSAAYQLIPEQSTAAIVLHHPDASYYTVGESRTEQLSK
jgi:methylmalonyl-CoA mutase cobalamin-binding domain/chain